MIQCLYFPAQNENGEQQQLTVVLRSCLFISDLVFFDFPNYYLTQQIEFYRLYDFSGKSKIRSGSVNGLVVLLVLIILLILLVLLIVLLLILVLRVSVLIVVHFRCSPLFCHK